MAAHNSARYVREAVASVLAQTYPNWELIIINDGSTDATADVICSLLEQNPSRPISVLSTPDIGPTAARRSGIAKSTGKYLLPLDADDRIAPEYLTKTVSVLESKPKLGAVYVDAISFGDSERLYRQPEYNFSRLCREGYFSYCSLIRRCAYDSVGGHDEGNWGYAEDWQLWIRLGAKGWFAEHLAEPLFYYRLHPATSLSFFLKRLAPHYRAYIISQQPEVYSAAERRQGEVLLAELPTGWHREPPFRGVSRLNEALQRYPENSHVLYFLAVAQQQSGDVAAATHTLHKLLDRHPNDQGAGELLAHIQNSSIWLETAVRKTTVFVLTINDVTFPCCLQALEKQTYRGFKTDIIRNLSPFNVAAQAMFDRCDTEYFIQLDEDMMLNPDAVERMEEVMETAPADVGMVCFHLYDEDLERKIQGIKIYRTGHFREMRFKDLKASELDLLEQMERCGVKWVLHPEMVGRHGTLYTPSSIYHRYRTMYEKDIRTWNLVTWDLRKKAAKFQRTGDINQLFALLGAVHGVVNAPHAEDKEKDYTQYSLRALDVFKRLLLTEPQQYSLYDIAGKAQSFHSQPLPFAQVPWQAPPRRSVPLPVILKDTVNLTAPGLPTLRVTYLITSILGVTGGNQTLLGHVNGLVARGHDVTVVTRTPKPQHTPINARVIQVPEARRMADFVPASDVVVATYFINAVELAHFKGPVKVYYAQGDQYAFGDAALKGTLHNQLRKLSDLSYLMEDVFFLPNSANLAHAVHERTRRLPDAVLPVMVNREIFQPTARDRTPEQWRILIVGPDNRGSASEPLAFKGIGDIRAAMQQLGQRTANFQVLRMSSSPAEIFAEYPCEFYHAPPNALKTRLYGSADILIYASHYDSCPRPPLEGMSAGCAVVCTDTAGAREYCEDGVNCRMVPIKSPAAIADAVWEIMTDAPLRSRLVQGGLATAERLDERQEIEVLEGLLRQFCNDTTAGKRPVGIDPKAAKPLPARRPAPLALPPVARIGQLTQAQELFCRKSPRAAWESAIAAIRVRPYHPEAYLLLAEIARGVGDGASARRCAQHARSLAPGFKPAQKFLKGNSYGETKVSWLVLPPALGGPEAQAKPRLSVCMIVKNEERFIGQCLASIRDVADEIIVVDTGSTDRTREIAQEHGAEIHAFAWCDDFSAARNAALERVTGDWVLILDADEELPVEQHATLRRLLADQRVLGWRLPLYDVGREAEGSNYVPRLFRNAPGLFYVGRVHEQVFYSVEARRKEWGLEIRVGDAVLRHHGYTEQIIQERSKIARNLRLLEQAVQEIPDDPGLRMQYGQEMIRSERMDEGLRHYRAAFEMMSARPPAEVMPEGRENLLTQYCTHLLAAKRPVTVLQVLTSPLAQNGRLTASLHFLLGVAQMEMKQFAAAVPSLRACLAQRELPTLTPVNREVRTVAPRHRLALCLWEEQATAEAELEFKLAFAEEPEAAGVHISYARFLQAHGNTAEALQRLNQFTSAHPAVLAGWTAGGRIALSQPALLEVAVDWTAVALGHHPADPTVLGQRAEALMLAGHLPDALPLWTKAGGAPNARVLAARLLCQTALGAEPDPLGLWSAETVSQEYIRWYRQLVEFGAESVVLQLHATVGALERVLPSAARLLQSVITKLAVPDLV